MTGSILASVTALTVLAVSSPSSWALKDKRHGVSVYTAPRAGSAFHAFKAVATIDRQPDAVLRVLDDVPRFTDWFAYTEQAKVLAETDDAKVIYLETQFPWPFANEDMIYRMRRSTRGSTTRIELHGLPSHLPPTEGVHRMKSARGSIEVEPVGAGTRVTYVMHTELGGRIPHWMANKNIHELPIRTLRGLSAAVQRAPTADEHPKKR